MSKQGQQGSNLIAQQGLAKSSSESTNFSESIKEHPSSSAPFGDKKDFFEKLSGQSDDQLQQGNVGQQGIRKDDNIINTQQGSSSELKKSSGSSSDIKKGSTFTTQQDSSSNLKESSTGSSDVKQESFKEHPSSSAPFGDKKDFFEKLSAQSDDQLQQGDVGQQGIRKDDNIINIQQGSSELKQSSGSSSDIKKGITFTSQQDSSSNEWEGGSTGTSNVKQESFKEHPSSSAPFGDKKDFFEKLSAQSDDQLQQGDVGQQGVKEDGNITTQQGSSELKKSSGSSDIEKGSTYTSQQDSSNEWKEGSTGSSDVKQESFKEHPSSSAPFGDKKDFFEKLSAQSDDQLQQGDVGQQGIKEDGNINTQQGPSSELKKSSGSSSDIKKGSTYTSQQDSSSDLKEGSTGKSDVKQESFKEHPSSSAPFGDKKDFFEKLSGQSDDQLQQGDVGQQGIKEDGNTNIQQGSSELKKSSGSSSDIKKGSTFTSQQDSSNEWKEGSAGTSDVEKDSFGKQDKGSNFGNDEVKWQGPSDETEFNSFGNKVSSDLKQTSTTSEPKETSSDVKGTMTSKPEEGKRDSDLIDFGSETKQDKSSSEGGFDLSGEISNLKIDSSSSFGQTKKKSVETGPFYDDKVHDDRNDTK